VRSKTFDVASQDPKQMSAEEQRMLSPLNSSVQTNEETGPAHPYNEDESTAELRFPGIRDLCATPEQGGRRGSIGSSGRRTSLEGYHKRMKEEQPAIYYMSGDAAAQMAAEPAMEIFKKRDLEVLFLTESNDEGCLGKVMDFEGVKLKSIQKAGDLLVNWNSEENQRFRDLGNMYRPLTKWWTTWASSQKAVKIGKVEVSRRLVSSPAVLVASEYGQSAKGERLQKGNANSAFMDMQKTLEINADHPVIHKMFKKIQADPDDSTLDSIAAAVTQAATLQSGFDLESADAIIDSVYKLISLKHGLDPKAAVTDVEIDIIEEPVEETEDEDVDDIEIGSDDDDAPEAEAKEDKAEL